MHGMNHHYLPVRSADFMQLSGAGLKTDISLVVVDLSSVGPGLPSRVCRAL
jgi:hypothetical protein